MSLAGDDVTVQMWVVFYLIYRLSLELRNWVKITFDDRTITFDEYSNLKPNMEDICLIIAYYNILLYHLLYYHRVTKGILLFFQEALTLQSRGVVTLSFVYHCHA